MSEKQTTVTPFDEKLPLGINLVYALQHVFVMISGAVAVPIIIGDNAHLSQVEVTFLISCALLAAGIATAIQTLGIKNFLGVRLPVIEATSFAAVGAMVSVVLANVGDSSTAFREIAGCVLSAGLFCFLMSGIWSKLLKFFPEVVTGTVVTIIGLTLFPVGIKWICEIKPGYGFVAPLNNIGLALLTLLSIIIFNKFLKGMLGNLSVLFGLIFGTIVAIFTGMSDFSSVITSPFVEVVRPWKYGLPIFNPASIISFILIMLVIMTEATGNMIAISSMGGKRVDEQQLKRGLRSSGFSTMVSSIFNSYPVTPFAQNVGMVSMTGVYSRFVTAWAAGILFVLAFFPKFAAIFASIPKPVLGGAGFAMFGMVAAGGIRTLGKVNYVGNKNALIVAISIGLSLIPVAVPNFFIYMPKWTGSILHSGITIGCASAILLNIFFNVLWVPKDSNPSVK